MIRRLSKTIFVLAALSFLAGLTWSEVFCVSNATQLQNALTEAATNGDEDIIRVVQGTYIGNFTFDSYEGREITLKGGYSSDCTSRILDPSNTILDGNNAGRVLYINNPGGLGSADIFIEGFTIQNGNTTEGAGGIYAASCVIGSPGCITIKDNIITGNSASTGGGIGAYTDDENFGPFIADEMDVKISMKKILRSTPRRLRARDRDEGDIVIIDNIIENNYGGGIVAIANADVEAGSISIIDNTITGNTGRGVKTHCWGESTKICGNTISGNTSLEKGGGVYASGFDEYGGGDITFKNNIITDNSSVEGGGIYSRTDGKWDAGDLSLINNTITGNLCSDSGGGVCIECVSLGTLNLYNNIIWGNSALAGGDIFMKMDPEYLFWIESNGFNNDYTAFDGIWTSFGGNIHANPQFRDLGNNDFHLKFTSPCIDAGANSAPLLPTDDFDGDPRILDGNDDGTARVDIGADEFVWVPLQTLTIMSSGGGSTDPAPGEHLYAQGTEVTLTAIPDDHYRFSHWSGDVSSSENPISITMNADKSLTANFIRQCTLVLASNAGGTIDPSPRTYMFDVGVEVTLTAIPDMHYRFSHWSGDILGADNPIKITMNSDMSITANFTRFIYAPLNFTGQKVLNRSLSQAEYINVLNWQANPDNINIVKYRIYLTEGESKNLLVELNANTYQYWHRRVEQDKLYTYAICAVNDEDREGDPGYITVQ